MSAALVPTARAVGWTPLLATTACLALLAGLLDLAGAPQAGAARWLGTGALASAALLGLRDPAAGLTAPLPVPRLARRLLRLALLATPASVACVAYAASLPGSGPGTLPALGALLAVGVAAATWLPDDDRVTLAAALPLLWVAGHGLVGGADLPSAVSAPLGWWREAPYAVVGVSVLAVALGRHR